MSSTRFPSETVLTSEPKTFRWLKVSSFLSDLGIITFHFIWLFFAIDYWIQLVEKDPERAIPLFWSAINAGDRVDSALKDMAMVMKQQDRAEEAIEAIKSLRVWCSDQAHESLDNILLDLYKVLTLQKKQNILYFFFVSLCNSWVFTEPLCVIFVYRDVGERWRDCTVETQTLLDT